MITYGDECRRTQHGNNNAYCQDNEISWFDWDKVEENQSLVRFFRELIKFRREQPTVRRTEFLSGTQTALHGIRDVSWFNRLGTAIDWNSSERTLTCLLMPPDAKEDPEGLGRELLIMFNPTPEPCEFMLPTIARGISWRMKIDTSAKSPDDIFESGKGPVPASRIILTSRSMCCFIAE